MPKVTFFISLLTGIAAAQQKSNPFNLVSAATLFTGPESPVVDTGYGLFKGKSDQLTGTENYLGELTTFFYFLFGLSEQCLAVNIF